MDIHYCDPVFVKTWKKKRKKEKKKGWKGPKHKAKLYLKKSLTAREITYNNFEISLMVFMSNITTNHAITYTNIDLRHQYGISVAESQTFLRAKRPQLRRARRNGGFRRLTAFARNDKKTFSFTVSWRKQIKLYVSSQKEE